MVLLLAAVWGLFAERASEVTISLAVIGAGLVVTAAVLERLVGPLRIGPTGFEIAIAEIAVGEHQLQTGQVVDAKEAVEASLSAEGTLTAEVTIGGTADVTTPSEEGRSVIIGRDTPPVLLTEAAHDVMGTLDTSDRKAFYAALKDLGKTGRDKQIASTRAGIMYMERRVSPGVALVYRLLDKTSEDDPDRYVIIAIETPSHRISSWPDDIQFWP